MNRRDEKRRLFTKYGLGRYISSATIPAVEAVSILEQLEFEELEFEETAVLDERRRRTTRPPVRSKKYTIRGDKVAQAHVAMVAKYDAIASGLKAVIYEALPWRYWFGHSLSTAALVAFFNHNVIDSAIAFLLTLSVAGFSKWAFKHG